jgi:hypothetical protein
MHDNHLLRPPSDVGTAVARELRFTEEMVYVGSMDGNLYALQ